MSPYLSAGASASANTTPVASHVTAAAQVSTRSHGALRLSTAPMSASVSVLVFTQLCAALQFKALTVASAPAPLRALLSMPSYGAAGEHSTCDMCDEKHCTDCRTVPSSLRNSQPASLQCLHQLATYSAHARAKWKQKEACALLRCSFTFTSLSHMAPSFQGQWEKLATP